MHTLAIYDRYTSRLIAYIGVICAIMVFLYGVLLLLAVSNAAQASTAERQVWALSGQVSALEGERLALQKTLTPRRGTELGLVEPSATTVIYVSQSVLSLGL
ncbi:MAG: hypothetical protein UY83_C0002G0085 [Candidatus Adlerbacteria bacterium GW2011_GWA1_54_10]|uniref:Cell division protein FtsL n=3 Tax=Candidatus Adleribacteriota TaxID=1752736 RepID=A0A1F4Y0Q5_9BACT|nr:MAG: hypothetical protein UY83_C0002G0085 [Candidatus Adlerbacteria bacterium GW2011_GWA1_54_10]KKW37931.1 MAG: hypothetical protein UY86_C0002G0028 [Candidatus Adlerbacteria bacterium GW2011_GWB1_54_7]OGC87550.1 MAG: hypothetical protein A3B33_01395 [Candidatus Adlerbacteria bacterium RIFCSPLOWO2_01_FULL_54_16]